MDGVLIDSLPVMKMSWQECCDKHKLTIPFQRYLEHVGKPFEKILELLDIDKEDRRKIKTTYSAKSASCSHKTKKYKGIIHVLKILKMNKIKTAVVTSKEYFRADDIVSSLLLPVDELITPEYTLNGKPDPEPLLYALNALSERPGNALYIGDMKSDMESANAAGMAFAKANWGYGEFSCKHICLDSPQEILELLGIG